MNPPDIAPPALEPGDPPASGAATKTLRAKNAAMIDRAGFKVKPRILIPLTAAMAVMLCAFIVAFRQDQERRSALEMNQNARRVQSLLHQEQARMSSFMATTLQAIMSDDRLAEAFELGRVELLLSRSRPLFDALRLNHRVTHFYFHTAGRTNLLRVHQPERSGGSIHRGTLADAARTGAIASGIERGPIGTFVLRVVTPWRRDGRLLGYLELGMEFEDILKSLHGLLQVDFVVAVDKTHLDRGQWTQALKTYGREGVWDRYPNVVVMDKTLAAIPDPVRDHLNRADRHSDRSHFVSFWEGKALQQMFLPLTDAGGRVLGEIVVLNDVTESAANARASILIVAGVSLAIGVALLGMFNLLLTRVEGDLLDRAVKLREEIAIRERAEADLRRAHDTLEQRVAERTQELKQVNDALREEIAAREQIQRERDQANRQLLETSRLAGMAEVASNVLHNVGNALNSVNVSSMVVADRLRKSKIAGLAKLADLLREHQSDLSAYLTQDPKGIQVPDYLSQLAEHLANTQSSTLEEISQLQKNIDHIKDIVVMQQSYAKISGIAESVHLRDLVHDALRMNASALARHDVEAACEFDELPPVTVERHKVMQILVNLIRNAKYACDDSGRLDKRITVRVGQRDGRAVISVEDNGIGIPAENLARIFNHGFTTRKEGHGFGLHSGATAAREMGGQLRAFSDGPGRGAVFTLELPFRELALAS